MATEHLDFPRRLTDNPLKWEEFVRAYDTPLLLTGVLGPAFVTVAGQAITRLMGHAPAYEGVVPLAAPWVLVAGILVAVLLSRRALERSRERTLPKAAWVHATLQMLWVPTLAWYSIPEFSFVLALALCAFAFNDARYLYDWLPVRLHYLLVWPGFYLLLLVVDLAGGPGVLARARTDPDFVRLALVLTVIIAVLLQVVLVVVGRQWYRLDAETWARGRLQAQLASLRREREVVVGSCSFIAQGLVAGQFSHDLASPISTANLSAAQLVEGLDELGAAVAVREDPALRTRIDTLRAVAHNLLDGHARIHEMTSALARSLRGGDPCAATDIGMLLERAVREMRSAASRHVRELADPVVDVEPCEVFVNHEHAAALGQLLLNGALQQAPSPVRVRGWVRDRWYYLLTIRDFATPERERESTLQRIRQSLSLVGSVPQEAFPREYAGFGLGLVLGKLSLVRHGGWLSVSEPEQGAGIEFTVVLPRVAPAEIPETEHRPEAVAEARHHRAPTAELSSASGRVEPPKGLAVGDARGAQGNLR